MPIEKERVSGRKEVLNRLGKWVSDRERDELKKLITMMQLSRLVKSNNEEWKNNESWWMIATKPLVCDCQIALQLMFIVHVSC